MRSWPSGTSTRRRPTICAARTTSGATAFASGSTARATGASRLARRRTSGCAASCSTRSEALSGRCETRGSSTTTSCTASGATSTSRPRGSTPASPRAALRRPHDDVPRPAHLARLDRRHHQLRPVLQLVRDREADGCLAVLHLEADARVARLPLAPREELVVRAVGREAREAVDRQLDRPVATALVGQDADGAGCAHTLERDDAQRLGGGAAVADD